MAGDTVAVLGGGVAGMSAAHELAQRGFEVTVYESRDRPGGKARSMPVPGTEVGISKPLPGEHGFRFFPGFYWHLPDTMDRISPDGSAFDGFVSTTQIKIAQAGGHLHDLTLPSRYPTNWDELRTTVKGLFGYFAGADIDRIGLAFFFTQMLGFMRASRSRRESEYENQSWLDFTRPDIYGEQYRKFVVDGMTRSMVAAKASEMSARTGASILLQLLFDMGPGGEGADHVLVGPTSDVWIDPWLERLQGDELRVRYLLDHTVVGLECSDKRIASVTVAGPDGGRQRVTADWYVSALPVEVMRQEHLLTPELLKAAPELEGLHKLKVSWMNGIMFYLSEDVPIVHGHTVYVDSPWALTSISQAQFWPGVDLGAMYDGRCNGILSVDISDWEAPGSVTGRAAMECTPEEIAEEVWRQLGDHLNDRGVTLEEHNRLLWFLDPAIQHPNPRKATNLEPLLVNTVGSLADRPDARTSVENLFLASDYVATNTDLATMEGANEAARAATNAILEASGSSEEECEIRELREPGFEPGDADAWDARVDLREQVLTVDDNGDIHVTRSGPDVPIVLD